MLAEDNPGDVFLVREALRAHQVEAEWLHYADGESFVSALEVPEFTLPDLILLDLNLPKINGFQILATIRNKPVLSKVPVAILTSSQSPEDQRRTAALGASSFIRKPTHLDEFLDQVGGAIRALLVEHPDARC